ncbi:cytochrome c oxidase cbb3-type subunit 1 [Sphingobium sp. AEW010]|nr:cytochrome c oxidase cbb3-type subunit 1 [Sphingobium sp. JAI105]TWD02913.1 cytochrome c oxidase cbb3-type subunit 1 [Sphingobium sp. AEW010]TWD20889.1 cytochrome c oxidase cbb3-type subunit 1 [Sphingobium sp. AEW013]TWD23664.1 cytochrome c oxidase cbb3-type subunit 1 [Sphingobium sp. AEW001]
MSARAGDFDEHISWGISMEQLVMKAGGWFALALLAAAAAVMAADSGFAVHMTIVAATGLLLAALTLKRADYGAIIRGALKMPDRGRYDDDMIRWGVIATIFWGLTGFLAGLYIALQLAFPALNLGIEYTSFGRLRPLHTSAVIFAFGGNALIATSFYVVQRTCRARLAFPTMARFVFWGYQMFIVLAATGYLMGITEGKEYAEPEWYVDLWLTVVWVCYLLVFGGTILKRSEPHIYVANWFYLSFIITIAMLHIVNNLSMPVSLLGSKSYAAFAGVQDALTQWWYGHNAVGFFLTAGFLAMMYYFVPKQAERPVYSYRLSIIHFWSLIFLYIWAGPHHLHYTALPDWAQTLGMVFSIMLWMPSWGGMINGLMTLNGAWDKIRTDPIIRMMVMALAFYGMSTFEGPMMSIKAVNSLSHYTDWTIGHVHSGALGWNGMITFACLYYMAPRLWGRGRLYSLRMVNWHFWLATVGIVLYAAAMWTAGIMQGLMWREYGSDGYLVYAFSEVVKAMFPMYLIRAAGGLLYLAGAIIMAVNIGLTIAGRQREEKPMRDAAFDPAADRPLQPHAA